MSETDLINMNNVDFSSLLNDMNKITEKKFELIAIKNMFNKNMNQVNVHNIYIHVGNIPLYLSIYMYI